ncbi:MULTISPECIES: phage tail protein [Cupriavidus]|jgi:phage-related protein|uniref:phage tail protein n=1 Tax=Cupriavidus TaxID=106589 RepID=UPI000578E578|nr:MULTISPECIES: phage tail protein [Cupriavidus]KWR80352.1 phage tail protein [Cupriavidus sp. SHE]QWC87702.1 phage tail protein [Cupriavidus metallidurans]
MAIETFTWQASGPGAQGDVTLRVRGAQFGDGYAQAVPDGINNKVEAWPLQFVGDRDTIKAIRDFLDRHAGATSFYWTPPLGEQGRYKVARYALGPAAKGVYTLSATFQQAFAP